MQLIRKAAVGGALVLTTVLGGALGATFVSGVASAQTDPSTTTTAPSQSGSSDAPATRPERGGGPHSANGRTEEALTGDVAAKVTAAAQAAVPDGTIKRVETDAEGTYEAHMTKADGTMVTVKVGADFAVTSVEEGTC